MEATIFLGDGGNGHDKMKVEELMAKLWKDLSLQVWVAHTKKIVFQSRNIVLQYLSPDFIMNLIYIC
jgi:hypothetical protein